QTDHKQANEQLRPIAQKYGVALDQSLTRHEQKELHKFEKMTGKDFDQRFATRLLKEHQKSINRFEQESTQTQAADVKQYVQTMLPKLQQHFQHAETVARAVGVDQSTISSIAKKTHGAMGGTSETQPMQSGAGSQESNPSGSGK
ncbi:MAG TPA: DUF4142 domain-containing protein, partial [Candidatus Sulfotelmatobacter sp.]|nr:DUF4142 domain-containing protein [Candidatus Sulfotelmatobacter sp.]